MNRISLQKIALDVNYCAGYISTNTRDYQLCWGDREMGTANSCTKCSQVAGFIQKVGRRSSKVMDVHLRVRGSNLDTVSTIHNPSGVAGACLAGRGVARLATRRTIEAKATCLTVVTG